MDISRQLKFQRDHIAQGLCRYCSAPMFKGGLCEKHYATSRAYITKRNKERFDRGICRAAYYREPNRHVHIGYFASEAQAAEARDNHVKNKNDQFAMLNFPIKKGTK